MKPFTTKAANGSKGSGDRRKRVPPHISWCGTVPKSRVILIKLAGLEASPFGARYAGKRTPGYSRKEGTAHTWERIGRFHWYWVPRSSRKRGWERHTVIFTS